MRIIDLTHQIEHDMPTYSTDPKPRIFPWRSRETFGYSANALFMAEHTGTHVDAPLHFIDGASSIDSVPLHLFYGDAIILRIRAKRFDLIGAEEIEISLRDSGESIGRGDRVLISTGWDLRWKRSDYVKNNPAINVDGAKYLVRKRASLVGIDTPSIDSPRATDFPVHNLLLAKGIVIIENLNLTRVPKSIRRFRLIAMPLRISGGTGSPIRAVAVVD